MKESCILTNGGNLLRCCDLGFYFQKPYGTFLREVSEQEATYVSRHGLSIDIEFINPHPSKFPIWKHIRTDRVMVDNSNYKWETCNNGGNYGFSTFESWFVAKVNDEWVFRYINHHSTTADFEYDELSNQFKQGLGGNLHIINTDIDLRFLTQCQYYDSESESVIYDVSEPLEKYSEVGSFEQLWNSVTNYYGSKWDDEDEDHEYPTLTFSDKKLIIERLREIGVQRIKRKLQNSKRR